MKKLFIISVLFNLKKRNTISLNLILFFLPGILLSQNTFFFQGGEGTANDNWNFTAPTSAGGPNLPGITNVLPRSGTFSIRAAGGNITGASGLNCISGGDAVGCGMHGKTILFATVCTSVMANVQLTCYHRTHNCLPTAGSGFDASETLIFEVSNNGGPFTVQGTVGGSGDYNWTYVTNPAGVAPTAPNPFVYNLPAGTNTFAFRVTANSNRSDEFFYIDDVSLTTSSTGIPYPVSNPCFAVLPITLTDFYAKPEDKSVSLYWNVATEVNVDYYLIEKSIDGENFTLVEKVKSGSLGEGKYNLNYSAIDQKPNTGINYYRLTNVDLDRSEHKHKLIMVNYNASNTINVWINQNETDIIISHTREYKNKEFYVMDMQGRIVGNYHNQSSNLDYFLISKSSLPKGLYVIGCKDGAMPPQKFLAN